MQQLDLFSKNSARQMRRTGSARVRRNSRAEHPATPVLDLWNQAPDVEKEMALFFLDIRNFTRLTQRHQAFDIIHIVKKLFSAFQHIIKSNHGRIVETSGDGFYAAFGFDCGRKQAVNAAVTSGKAIITTLEALNARSLEKNLCQRIDVGIGVHVGKVAIGNLPVGLKDHLVVMGYPVNVASRLQSVTKELNNNFIVSADAYRMLECQTETSPVKVSLKGIKDVVELYPIGRPYVNP